MCETKNCCNSSSGNQASTQHIQVAEARVTGKAPACTGGSAGQLDLQEVHRGERARAPNHTHQGSNSALATGQLWVSGKASVPQVHPLHKGAL